MKKRRLSLRRPLFTICYIFLLVFILGGCGTGYEPFTNKNNIKTSCLNELHIIILVNLSAIQDMDTWLLNLNVMGV